MGKVTANTWGVKPDLLKVWYRTVAERVIVYGASVWANSLNVVQRQKLLTVQRPILLRITRAYKTTANLTLCALSGIQPIYHKLIQEANMSRILRHKISAPLTSDPSDFFPPLTLYNKHPANTPSFNIKLTNSTPTYENLSIYTDGSKTPQGTAAAFCAYKNNVVIHSESIKMNPRNSVFQAELKAISLATDWYRDLNDANCNLFSDSLSGLMALKNPYPKYQQIDEIQKKIINLNKRLALHWVPAHVGIRGNETADVLAKQATQLDTINNETKLPKSALKTELKTKMQNSWKLEWLESEKGAHAKQFIPTVENHTPIITAALSRFISGHGPFPTYFKRFNISDSEVCACGKIGSPMHYATECEFTSQWHFKTPAPDNLKPWIQSIAKNKKLNQRLTSLINYLQENTEMLAST